MLRARSLLGLPVESEFTQAGEGAELALQVMRDLGQALLAAPSRMPQVYLQLQLSYAGVNLLPHGLADQAQVTSVHSRSAVMIITWIWPALAMLAVDNQ